MSSDRPSPSDRLFTWLLRLLPRNTAATSANRWPTTFAISGRRRRRMTAGSRGQDFGLGNRFPTPAARYDVFDQLLQSMRSLPNAEAAGGIDILPWSGSRPMRGLRRSGPPDSSACGALRPDTSTRPPFPSCRVRTSPATTCARVPRWRTSAKPRRVCCGQASRRSESWSKLTAIVPASHRRRQGRPRRIWWDRGSRGLLASEARQIRTMTVLARTSGDAGAFAAAMRTAACSSTRSCWWSTATGQRRCSIAPSPARASKRSCSRCSACWP